MFYICWPATWTMNKYCHVGRVSGNLCCLLQWLQHCVMQICRLLSCNLMHFAVETLVIVQSQAPLCCRVSITPWWLPSDSPASHHRTPASHLRTLSSFVKTLTRTLTAPMLTSPTAEAPHLEEQAGLEDLFRYASIIVTLLSQIEPCYVDLYWIVSSGNARTTNIRPTSHHQLGLWEESPETSAAALHLRSPRQDNTRGGWESSWSGEWRHVCHHEEAPCAPETAQCGQTFLAGQDSRRHDGQAEAGSSVSGIPARPAAQLPVQPTGYGWVSRVTWTTCVWEWVGLWRVTWRVKSCVDCHGSVQIMSTYLGLLNTRESRSRLSFTLMTKLLWPELFRIMCNTTISPTRSAR